MSSNDINLRVNGKANETGDSSKSSASGSMHTLMDGVNASYSSGNTLMGLTDGYPNMFYPSGTSTESIPGGPLPSYPNFGSADGAWHAPTYDPSMMGATGFNDSGLVTQPPMQSPHFYFPSNDSFWSSDLFFMNYPLFGGVPSVDQQQQQPQQQQQQQQQQQPSVTATTTATSSAAVESNTVDTLGQQFSAALTVNGTTLGMGLQDSLDNSNNSTGSAVAVETSPDPPSSTHTSSAPAPEKPKSWAAVAKLPPKPPQPKPVTVLPATEPKNGTKQTSQGQASKPSLDSAKRRPNTTGMTTNVMSSRPRQQPAPQGGLIVSPGSNIPDIVHKLHAENNYNPKEFSFSVTNARYFVIKSYAEDDIHRSIKYSIWTSTEHGNKRLDSAYREQKGKGNIYLFFSVNGSGHFCGVAQMASEVNFHVVTGVWSQDKWKGRFSVKWLYVKDVPNNALRHIRLENNENKPVTNSRDTQEIPSDKAKLVMKIVHDWRATSSIFDDFGHYEDKEQEDKKGSP